MEAYPENYVAHNLPLIVLSGLPHGAGAATLPSLPGQTASGSGASLSSDLPPLSGPHADDLLEEFLRADGASLAWSDHALSKRPHIGFKIASIGRVGTALQLPSLISPLFN